MATAQRSETATNLGLLLARVPLGFSFVLMGMSQLHGGAAAPAWVPASAAHVVAAALPWAELVAGGMLVLGLLGRIAGMVSLVVVALLATMAPFSLRGPVPAAYTLVGLTLLLMVLGSGAISVDSVLLKRKGR